MSSKLLIQWKNNTKVPEVKEENGVTFLQYPILSAIPWITHCFTTRLGGVSTEYYSGMNLSFTKGEPYEIVAENYRRLGAAVGFDWTRAVLSHQTHTTNIRRITKNDAGKGTTVERDYENVDGLITNEAGIALVTFYADCVPLYFVDEKHHAIGLSHSGWRGTVHRMGRETLRAMNEAFGTEPEDVIACIGPSICGDCFEVGPEVVQEFSREFTSEQMAYLQKPGEGEHSYLNLWKANEIVLLEAGIKKEHLSVTNLCTRCNPELLYSHRIMGEKRGNLAAVLMISDVGKD